MLERIATVENEQRNTIWMSPNHLIPGLPDDIVEALIWPRIEAHYREIETVSDSDLMDRLTNMISCRSVNKRWSHVIKYSQTWATMTLVAYDFEAIWNGSRSDENDFGQVESIRRNVASRFRCFINMLPQVRLLGGFTGSELVTFRSFWFTLDAEDKDAWIKKYSGVLKHPYNTL